MDPIMYLEAADLLLDGYTEVSYFSEVFEDGDTKDVMEKNADIEKKSVSLLTKAIEGIRSIFKKIRQLFEDVMSYVKADAGTKSEYQKFCDAIKANPEFAKKKVSFKQYSIIAKQWNDVLSAEEAQYRKLKDEELENKESFAKDISVAWDKGRAKIMDTSKIVAKEVAVEALVQEAKTCREGAISAKSKLEFYEMILGNLEKDLGKKEARKVKRKLKMLSSRFALVRKLAGGLEKEYLTWKDAMKNVFSASGAVDITTRNAKIRNAVGTTAIEGARIAATGAALGKADASSDKRKLNKIAKDHDKEITKLKKIMSDPNLRDDQKAIYAKRRRARMDIPSKY